MKVKVLPLLVLLVLGLTLISGCGVAPGPEGGPTGEVTEDEAIGEVDNSLLDETNSDVEIGEMI